MDQSRLRLSYAKVNQLDILLAFIRKDNVLWLQVSVDDPDVAQVLQSVEHLARHGLQHVSRHTDEQGIHTVFVQVLAQYLGDNHVMTSEAEAFIIRQQVV